MRIANLAYGSQINQPHSNNYGASVDIRGDFEQAEGVEMPLSFGRLSSAGTNRSRITLVSSENGIKTPLFFAESSHTSLDSAIKNVRLREGTSDWRNIAFISKSDRRLMAGEKEITVDGERYIGRWKNVSAETAEKIAGWMKSHDFDAATFSNFDANRSESQISGLLQNRNIRQRTKSYFENLPEPVKSVFSTFKDRIFNPAEAPASAPLNGDRFKVLRLEGAADRAADIERVAQEILRTGCKYSSSCNLPTRSGYNPRRGLQGDCISTLRHLMKTAIGYNMPFKWMAELPRGMLNDRNANVQVVEVTKDELKAGDFIFWKGNYVYGSDTRNNRLNTHITMALGPNKIFHNTPAGDYSGAKIESLDRIKRRAKIVNDTNVLTRYIDPRSPTGRPLYASDHAHHHYFRA